MEIPAGFPLHHNIHEIQSGDNEQELEWIHHRRCSRKIDQYCGQSMLLDIAEMIYAHIGSGCVEHMAAQYHYVHTAKYPTYLFIPTGEIPQNCCNDGKGKQHQGKNYHRTQDVTIGNIASYPDVILVEITLRHPLAVKDRYE